MQAGSNKPLEPTRGQWLLSSNIYFRCQSPQFAETEWIISSRNLPPKCPVPASDVRASIFAARKRSPRHG